MLHRCKFRMGVLLCLTVNGMSESWPFDDALVFGFVFVFRLDKLLANFARNNDPTIQTLRDKNP